MSSLLGDLEEEQMAHESSLARRAAMRRLREALAPAQVALEGRGVEQDAELWFLVAGKRFWIGNYDSSTVIEENLL